MDTAEKPKKKFQYIILIPHRDALRELEKYRQKLFSLGFNGAYSFPLCAPLASISRPFSREELKELAKNIRKLSLESEGNLVCGENAIISYTEELYFFGPKLNININELQFNTEARSKFLSNFSPPIICTALVKGEPEKIEQIPELSFRAACLASLVIRPLAEAELSFEWKMSPPVWLTSHRKLLHF